MAAPPSEPRRSTIPTVLRAGLVLAMALTTVACVQPATGEEHSAPPPVEPEVTAPACDAAPADALAVIDTRQCPIALRRVDGELMLHRLEPQPTPGVRGTAPEVCERRPCSYEGIDTTVGTLVFATVTAAESEMPAGQWLGVEIGGRLRFVDLWEGAGDDVIVDGTTLGPGHALLPYDCDGKLVLRAAARIDSTDVPLPPALQAREGTPVADGPDAVTMAPVSGADCQALAVPML